MEVDVEYKKAIAGDRSARKDLLEAFYAGIEVDVVDQWLKKAIADKDERLVFAIADWFEEVKKDHKKYLEVLKIASDMGNEAASYWLGEAYREGKICAREFDKALEFYRKADQQGADFEEVFANPFVPDEAPIRDSGNDGFTLDWWKFVLERYPTPALKNALECAEKTSVDAAEDHVVDVGVVSKRFELNEAEKDVGDNYEELTTRTRETRSPDDDWMFPNGHDDGEAPDTGAFGG